MKPVEQIYVDLVISRNGNLSGAIAREVHKAAQEHNMKYGITDAVAFCRQIIQTFGGTVVTNYTLIIDIFV